MSFRPALLFAVLLLVACHPPRPDIVEGRPMALQRLVRHGFAIDPVLIRSLEGYRITVWGYLDVGNIAVRRSWFSDVDPGWWLRPGAPYPYFDLKSRIDDKTGASTRVVVVANEEAFRPFFRRLIALARRNPADLRIEVSGKVKPFDAPMNLNSATGFVIEVDDPGEIVVRP
jgi:hypothetical protein